MSREYTDEFKQEALRIVEELGGNISAAADHLDISTRLLTCWVRQKTLQQVTVIEKLKAINIDGNAGRGNPKSKSETIWPTGTQPPPPLSRLGFDGFRTKQGLMRRPYATENLNDISSEDSRRVSNFLSTIQSITTDTLKLKQNQIGTVYPIEVEMELPEQVNDYCNFDLLQSDQSRIEGIRFTVLLSAMASGYKLNPVMLVEGVPDKLKRDKFPPDVKIVVGRDVSFDGKAFAQWKNDVWLPVNGREALIIAQMPNTDSSLTPVYQNIGYLHEGTMIALMPVNLTHLVHPAIVFWIRPFAEMLRDRLAEWLEDAEGACTTFQSKRTANYELFAEWVLEAWAGIQKELIIESFEACGLTHFTPTDLHPDLQKILDNHAAAEKQKTDVPCVDLTDDTEYDDVQIIP